MPILTILIEDNKTIRDALIPSMAEMAGVQIIALAEASTDAINALKEHDATWQLAVVDMFLKQGNGLTVLKACRDRRPDQFMIVLTNYPTPDIREACAEAGADAVFDKSTELELLFEYLRDLQSRPTS